MDEPVSVIVVDDEPALRAMIADYLSLHGFAVQEAENAVALDRLLTGGAPRLILLDVNMPGEDGLSVLRRLRGQAQRMGILMLTANAAETSRVQGLTDGADDYIPKPFDLRELVARMRSVLRRMTPPPPSPVRQTVRFGACALDLDGRRLFGPDGAEITVSAMEFELLDTFARHPRQILSRERLCELAHGRPLGHGDRSVDIRITRLRSKIESDPANPRLIQTIRGEGYVHMPDQVD